MKGETTTGITNNRMSNNNAPNGSGDEIPQDDIFNERDKLLEIWKEERRSRDKSADLMWENLKLFSVLIPAIITVGTIFLRLALDPSLAKYIDDMLLLSLVFPVLVVSLSLFGISDLYRRWKRTLEAIAHLLKIEGLLGLHEEYTGRFLKGDKHLFERYYWNTKFKKKEKDIKTEEVIEIQVDIETEDDFIKRNIFKNNMFTAMLFVYLGLGVIGGFLLYLIIPLYIHTLNQN
jgi:hypothetical protein